jgi:acyl-coenzyme A thioesterase PaaI-like protein
MVRLLVHRTSLMDPEVHLSPEPSECCFACGARNTNGLQLKFHSAGSTARAEWCPSATWDGYRHITHGGVVSTVLDEAMCEAILFTGHRGVTCDLGVRLRVHVEPGESLSVVGWVVDKRKRRIRTEATLTSIDGHEKAPAWATFLAI